MARHRDVAASPVRTTGATWSAISDLVVVTLERSPTIDAADVSRALKSVAAAGRALVAGGYLDRLQLTVVASPLYLTIGTVSGEAAFRALEQENSSPVPGAATAEAWVLYLPRPVGLAPLVDEIAEGVDHVSAGDAPAETAVAERSALTIDLARLDPDSRR